MKAPSGKTGVDVCETDGHHIFYTACFHVTWVRRAYLVNMCYKHDPLRLVWETQSFISSFEF